MIDIDSLLLEHDLILEQAALVERLRRSDRVTLHPRLVNALLIYDATGAREMSRIFDEYISIAHNAGFPIVITTPTWRANKERLLESEIALDVNKDAVNFLKNLRSKWSSWQENIVIGGLIGCRHDCYRPAEGLSMQDAYDFHSWQINKLTKAGVDLLIVETLPAVPEATGIARAMSNTGIPYIISFVIDRSGRILDGSTLEHAFDEIDSVCDPAPTGFMINCSYPSFLNADKQSESIFSRLIGFVANASSRDQSTLDGAETLVADDLSDWGNRMIQLNKQYGVKILGGCCGTDAKHLQYIVDNTA